MLAPSLPEASDLLLLLLPGAAAGDRLPRERMELLKPLAAPEGGQGAMAVLSSS